MVVEPDGLADVDAGAGRLVDWVSLVWLVGDGDYRCWVGWTIAVCRWC